MATEIRMKMECFDGFFKYFFTCPGPLVQCHVAFGNLLQSGIQSFRNTISRKMVCGQAQPHHSLPKVTVNRMMNRMKESISRARIRVSWAQKMAPKRMNFRLAISSRIKGFPLILIKGTAMKNRSTNQLKMVRRVYHFPLGFFAYTHFRLPLFVQVDGPVPE